MKPGTTAVALLACLAVVGCAAVEDEDVVPGAPSTSSTSSDTETTTALPSVPSASASATAARGPVLEHDYARLRMPQGWSRTSNFGVPFLRQANSADHFGIVTFAEMTLKTSSLDDLAETLRSTAIARGLRRRPNVPIGGGRVNAVRLAGWTDRLTWEETYGVLAHGGEWTINFTFRMENGTPARRQEIIDSVLASFEFTV